MAPLIAPPDSSTIIPPFLACLPTALCASRPPPALLPLLSPILRQRVQYLSSTAHDSDASWLPLLCWDPSDASELVRKVETTTFEPHPVSGEIELGDIETPLFRRKDEETLQSVLRLPEFGLMVIYVWCEHDEPGGGPGWRVAELRLLDQTTRGASFEWVESIGKADTQFEVARAAGSQLRDASSRKQSATVLKETNTQEDDDDDDYWALYDDPSARTPAVKRSPAPIGSLATTNHVRTASEDEYFARYGSVQPEMDHHDPNGEHGVIEESTLRGNELLGHAQRAAATLFPLNGHSLGNGLSEPDERDLVHTRPSSSSSASAVPHLEHAAQEQSASEIVIQQHITTNVKSLWRLARGTGIDTHEFKRIVRNELDLLHLLEEDLS